MGYSDLIEIAIKTEESIMGQAATGLAEDIEGLIIEDDEVIRVDGDGKEILEQLVDSYKAATGQVAPRMISDSIEDESDEDLELPESLEEV